MPVVGFPFSVGMPSAAVVAAAAAGGATTTTTNQCREMSRAVNVDF